MKSDRQKKLEAQASETLYAVLVFGVVFIAATLTLSGWMVR